MKKTNNPKGLKYIIEYTMSNPYIPMSNDQIITHIIVEINIIKPAINRINPIFFSLSSLGFASLSLFYNATY